MESITLCRTCRKSSSNVFPLTYTTTDHKDIDFATMLRSCTSVRVSFTLRICFALNSYLFFFFFIYVQINSKDSLPKVICEDCVMKLIAAYIFKQECERSDQLFRAYPKRSHLKRKSDQGIESELIKADDINIKQGGKIKRQNSDNNEKKSSLKENAPIEKIEIKVEKTELVECDCDNSEESNLLTQNELIKINDNENVQSGKIETENDDTNVENKLNKINDVAIEQNEKIKTENDEIKDSSTENKLTQESEVKVIINETVRKECENSEKNDLVIQNKETKKDDIESMERAIIKIENCDEKDTPIEDKINIKIKSEVSKIRDDSFKDFAVIRKKYKRKPKIYPCLVCGKELASQYGLTYHMTAHGNSRDIVCPIEGCNSKFMWEPALKRHMLKHQDKKEHLCELCGKGYNTADSLRYHMGTHRGERRHLCTYCGKTFTQMVHLTYHINVHTKKKKYICGKCNRTYLGPTQLRKHWRMYCGAGRKPPPERRHKNKQL